MSRSNNAVLVKNVYYLNNLTRDSMSNKYTVLCSFIHTHCAYSANNKRYLTLFPSSSVTRKIQCLSVNITFFDKCFLFFIAFLSTFGFNLDFFVYD